MRHRGTSITDAHDPQVHPLEGLVIDEHEDALLGGEQCVESDPCGTRHDDSFCVRVRPVVWHDALAIVLRASKTCPGAGR